MENYCLLYSPSTKVPRGCDKPHIPRDRVPSNVDLGSQKKEKEKSKIELSGRRRLDSIPLPRTPLQSLPPCGRKDTAKPPGGGCNNAACCRLDLLAGWPACSMLDAARPTRSVPLAPGRCACPQHSLAARPHPPPSLVRSGFPRAAAVCCAPVWLSGQPRGSQ